MNYRSEEQRFDAEQQKLFDYQQGLLEQEAELEYAEPPMLAAPFGVSLRPYQVEAVKAALALRDANPLIVMATGLGKTTVFCEIILRRLAEDPGDVLILAHRRELLEQASGRVYEQIGKKTSTIDEPWTRVVVSSVQKVGSMLRRKKFLPEFSTIVVDEAHHASASQYKAIFERYSKAWMVGVTATPERQDLEDLPFKEVFKYSLKDGIRDGFLCPLKFKLFEVNRPTEAKLRVQAGDFVLTDLGAIIDLANEKIIEVVGREARGKKSIAFFPTVETARHFHESFLALGFRSDFIHGGTPREQRSLAIERYRQGDTEILCNCAVLTEGFDAPETDCIIMARPTKSQALYLQCIGRGSRNAPGKKECTVLQFGFRTAHADFEVRPASVGQTDVIDEDRLMEAPPADRKPVFKRSTGDLLSETGWLGADLGDGTSHRELAKEHYTNALPTYYDGSFETFVKILGLRDDIPTLRMHMMGYIEACHPGICKKVPRERVAEYFQSMTNYGTGWLKLANVNTAWFLWRFKLPPVVPQRLGEKWKKEIIKMEFRLGKKTRQEWTDAWRREIGAL